MKLVIVTLNNLLASLERLYANSESPMMVIPAKSIVTPFWVNSQLPPLAAAKSMITEPYFIASTVLFSINLGADLPGMLAVVMTISAFIAFS